MNVCGGEKNKHPVCPAVFTCTNTLTKKIVSTCTEDSICFVSITQSSDTHYNFDIYPYQWHYTFTGLTNQRTASVSCKKIVSDIYFIHKTWHLWNNSNLEYLRKLRLPINKHCNCTAQSTTWQFLWVCSYDNQHSIQNEESTQSSLKSLKTEKKDAYLNIKYSDKIRPLRIVLYKASYTTAFLWPHAIAICCIYLNNCWRHSLKRKGSHYL